MWCVSIVLFALACGLQMIGVALFMAGKIPPVLAALDVGLSLVAARGSGILYGMWGESGTRVL